ncbi:MAG TPA: hypothetical protein VHT05_13610 [Candidatus Elarobacter sp.]|nr:hypothetical protein [Candidatus Elarobacter sp.]
MIPEAPAPPQIRLTRPQWIRLVVVGIFVVLALGRVVPDFVRFVYPLQIFHYVTDDDGTVIAAAPRPKPTAAPHRHHAAHQTHPAKAAAGVKGKKHAAAPKASPTPEPVDYAAVGDRVRVDRIKPFDRKPGLAGRGFTYDNPDRHLPVERAGKLRVLHLVAGTEPIRDRTLDILRIFLAIVAVGLGAILFLVKPSITTAAFFIFCLGAIEAPTTYADLVIPNPWRPIPEWIGDTLHGMVRPALLLFALCLIDGDDDAPRERIFAWCATALGLVLGTLNAYADWLLTYAGHPAAAVAQVYKDADYGVMALTGLAFAVAFVRARTNDRHRIGWIVAAFVFAGLTRLMSDELYPAYIQLWFNSILVSMTIVPIIAIWIAVVRHQFFNVDFVVGRAVVYAALTAAGIGTIMIGEELASYLFYNNVDVAYGVIIAASMAFGAFTGKLSEFLKHFVDRFIFRDRHQQREALEFIAGYILDAENAEDVYRALLQDAAHALQLAFGGILVRQRDGSYELGPRSEGWPDAFHVRLGPTDDLTAAIARSRGALTFSGKETRMIQASFPNDPLTFAAPLFFDRVVSGIVVYGHNVSGLDLDPDERELLVRVVAHASIALNAIELNRYRNPTAAPEPLPAV